MDQMRVQNIAVKYIYLGEQPIAGEKYYHKYMVQTDKKGKKQGAREGSSKTGSMFDAINPGTDGQNNHGTIVTQVRAWV